MRILRVKYKKLDDHQKLVAKNKKLADKYDRILNNPLKFKLRKF